MLPLCVGLGCYECCNVGSLDVLNFMAVLSELPWNLHERNLEIKLVSLALVL